MGGGMLAIDHGSPVRIYTELDQRLHLADGDGPRRSTVSRIDNPIGRNRCKF